ncbi:MAG: hypothetical protein IPH94_14615 [Saprospiraceae bacterium]|nr:hypothetical protein [Saprospiraceae bacterium]MBK7222508.1 hypothetical protein [Saprospiraceae bacterium]MBK8111289.1 hypothetical protein [Saprospiraceae bacterium]MBK8852097.1 hypothetical protein [Saprospiraceae bacterium]MBL0082270.1 hypothetical protein [Saprospiraceae bacterium]
MFENVFKNWTFVRALYLVLGLIILSQSAIDKQWAGVFLGGYFMVMGLFSLGCAGGSCARGNCAVPPNKQ